MAVSKEILDLIPEGCKVNWNEKQQRFYVYKSTYYYSKEHKRSREQRTQVVNFQRFSTPYPEVA